MIVRVPLKTRLFLTFLSVLIPGFRPFLTVECRIFLIVEEQDQWCFTWVSDR